MVLRRPARPSRTTTQNRYHFHYRELECKSRKSRDTWSNRQVWPWSTKLSRSKANRVLPREPIANTLFQQHKRRLYTWTSPDGQYQNQIDYILCIQARALDWVAISFSNAGKWKVKVKSLSRVQPPATPWTAAYQAPSMGFSRQEYWSGVPLPSPYQGSNLYPLLWKHRVLTSGPPGKSPWWRSFEEENGENKITREYELGW